MKQHSQTVSKVMNNITFIIFIAFWPIWLLWESILLVERGEDTNVQLISMVARQRGYQMNSLPFTWAGLLAHFWLNWHLTRVWTSAAPTIVFWALVAGTLVLDIVLWSKPYDSLPKAVKIFRNPIFQVVFGLLAGLLLFPQQALS